MTCAARRPHVHYFPSSHGESFACVSLLPGQVKQLQLISPTTTIHASVKSHGPRLGDQPAPGRGRSPGRSLGRSPGRSPSRAGREGSEGGGGGGGGGGGDDSFAAFVKSHAMLGLASSALNQVTRPTLISTLLWAPLRMNDGGTFGFLNAHCLLYYPLHSPNMPLTR